MAKVVPYESSASNGIRLQDRRKSAALIVDDRRSSNAVSQVRPNIDRRKSEVLSRYSFHRNSFEHSIEESIKPDTTRGYHRDLNSSDEEIRENIHNLIQNKDLHDHEDKENRSEVLSLININQRFHSKSEAALLASESELMTPSISVHRASVECTPNTPMNLKPIPKCLFVPDSLFGNLWNTVIILALIYTATFMPFLVAFYDSENEIWQGFDIAIDSIFIIDLLVNFNMAFYSEDGELVTDRKIIVKTYLKTWFILDLTASFPFSFISVSNGSNGSDKLVKLAKIPRIYRIIRFLRVIKIAKAARFTQTYQEVLERLNITATAVRGFKFFFIIALLLHLISCLWYFDARIEDFNWETWVMRYDLMDTTEDDKYLWCIYWAITVMDTIGYGDIVPVMLSEKIICLIWLFFGVSFYSYTISNLSVIFYNMNTRNNYIQRKEEFLKEFAKNVKLPKSLLNQVKYYVRYNYKHNVFSWSDMNNFLKELPSKLYTKVYKHIFKDVLDNVNFFKNKPPAFISEIMPLMKSVVVHEGYELYPYGSTPRDIFFLLKGRVRAKDKHDSILFSYVRGSYFGETELLFKTDRKSTTQVEETANLLKIDGQDFLAVLERFPEIKSEVYELAEKRLAYYEERKSELKKLREECDSIEILPQASMQLSDIKPIVEDIMKIQDEKPEDPSIKIEDNNIDEEQACQEMIAKIKKTVVDIKKKTSEVSDFYYEVFKLKREQEKTLQMLNEVIELIRKKKLKKAEI
ncbi:unnamed protein product [Blepharisma stoltei]|uniref:Cyclic nucleotide-binding domain-containing protein n=1 Tax=Blepharisma stoltei TaxID=1481888 RepID=A0AAU9II44_9CILI|nr:unnamed protein product [Blepharisma stoltei]